ncbi:MAG: 5-oxoprolinase subunit PxpA [Chitinophagales bacterium]
MYNTIDLNCDMGEGMMYDAQLMQLISSANIACGFHAGDEDTMNKTIELAIENKVAIGAHPGFPDKEYFGRRNLPMSTIEIYEIVTAQIVILKKIADQFKIKLHHVKPHGALYNLAAKDRTIAQSIAHAVNDADSTLMLYGLSGSYLVSEAHAIGLKTVSEVFADRTYQDDGTLTPRTDANALIETEEKCIAQVLQMTDEQTVTSVHTVCVPIVAQTICLHSDGKNAVAFAKKIVEALKQQQIEISAP